MNLECVVDPTMGTELDIRATCLLQ